MGGDNVGTGRGIYQKPQMSEGRLLTFQAISNVALTLSLVLAAVLCYLLAVPFLPPSYGRSR